MKNYIRQFFIPTLENEKQPYALHPAAFVTYLVVAVALLVAPAYVHRSQLANLSSPYRAYGVIELVNGARQIAGLPVLNESEALNKAAAEKARDIFEKQYFAHISPEQKTPWDFFRAQNYVYSAAGENLAIDYVTLEDAHAGLMASPTHRANILNSTFTEIGVAVLEGTMENRQSVVIVQFFGKPKTTVAAAQPVAPAAKPAPTKVTAVPAGTVKSAETAKPAETAASSVTTSSPSVTESLPEMLVSEIYARIPESLASIQPRAFPYVPVVALFALSGMLLALTFVFTRRETLRTEAAMRAFLFVLIFGYIAATGGVALRMPSVAPAAMSIIK